jgi:hypothetical protein
MGWVVSDFQPADYWVTDARQTAPDKCPAVMVTLLTTVQHIMTGQVSKHRQLTLVHFGCCHWASYVNIWACILWTCTKISTYHLILSLLPFEGRRVGKISSGWWEPQWGPIPRTYVGCWSPATQIQNAALSLPSSSTFHQCVRWRCCLQPAIILTAWSQNPFCLDDCLTIDKLWWYFCGEVGDRGEGLLTITTGFATVIWITMYRELFE